MANKWNLFLRYRVIERDYAMVNGTLCIPTNASLIRYLLDAYNIDIHMQKNRPQGQQIVVGNMDELMPYLLGNRQVKSQKNISLMRFVNFAQNSI